MELKEIETLLFMETGAPVPMVLSDEHTTCLLYYYRKPVENTADFEIPKERDAQEDRGIAVITFGQSMIYKFGYPNDEVLLAHSYYSLGLESYQLFEVIGSEWIQEIKEMNKAHPLNDPLLFSRCRHFIITFKDSTFECIAAGLKIEFNPMATMKEGIETVASKFWN
jgi:hypothetical protein